MALAIDKDAIRQAYDDVRSNNSDTDWAAFKFDGNKLNVTSYGSDFKEFKSTFTDDDRGLGFIRINTGDELSKRAKFVFVAWVGKSVSPLKRAKMSVDKAAVKEIIQNYAVELLLEDQCEFRYDHFKAQCDKAGGANYGTGKRGDGTDK